jgi:hypothetical protein
MAALPLAGRGQAKEPDLKDYLAGVTDRGHQLYEYDQAAWHGTDAIMALDPVMAEGSHYICTKTTAGWRLVFPRWDAVHEHLLIAYEAVETTPGKYEARKIDPPQDAGDDLLAKERALELALSDFPHQDRPYNTAILHAPGGNLYVYFYPGQTKDTVWPLGGDMRYRMSPDGRTIVEKRQLHKSILDMEFDPAKKPVSGFHTHVLSDVPEDTDVLYVLNRRPLIPEYVGTLGGWIFVINTDGTIGSIPPCTKGNPLPCKKK